MNSIDHTVWFGYIYNKNGSEILTIIIGQLTLIYLMYMHYPAKLSE